MTKLTVQRQTFPKPAVYEFAQRICWWEQGGYGYKMFRDRRWKGQQMWGQGENWQDLCRNRVGMGMI